MFYYFYKQRRNFLITLLIILVIAIVGLLGVKDQGISSDEITEVRMVQANVTLIQTGKDKFTPPDVRYYGTVFNFTAEGVFHVYKNLFGDPETYDLLEQKAQNLGQKYPLYFQKIRIKHYVTFVWVLLTYFASSFIVGVLTKGKGMFLTPIVLCCLPRFWGHSFFNPKDSPFATFFTICTLFSGLLIGLYSESENNKKNDKILIFFSILYGIVIGILSGIRIGGILFVFLFFSTHFYINFQRENFIKYILSFWKLYSLILVSCLLTITFIHPASWSNPLKWLYNSLKYLSKHSWSGTNLFNGQFIPASSSPWYYIPEWFAITTPIFILLMCLIGLLLGMVKYEGFDYKQKACLILVILQGGFLPLIAISRNSTVYDGIRQFLFVFPSIAILATFGIIVIYQTFPKKMYRYFWVSLVAISLGAIIINMIALHPYQYVYFNRFTNGLAGAYGKFETDYWGLSMREGMEWINERAKEGEVVISSNELHSSKMFATPNLPVADYRSYEASVESNNWNFPHFYYIAKPRWDYQEKLPECPIVYSVERQGIPLTIVKKCSNK